MKGLSHQTDIDWLSRCVYTVCVFVGSICRCVGGWAHTVLYQNVFSSLYQTEKISEGNIFLFPLRFNENQAQGKVSLLVNRHQAITQLTLSNHSATREGAGNAWYTQTHTFMYTVRRGCYKLSLSSIYVNTYRIMNQSQQVLIPAIIGKLISYEPFIVFITFWLTEMKENLPHRL